MKSLVIAEKPSVARDIARVLHCTQDVYKRQELCYNETCSVGLCD